MTILLFLCVVTVFTLSVTQQTTEQLRSGRRMVQQKQVFYVGLSGLQVALEQLRANDNYNTDIPATSMPNLPGLSYSVDVTNNVMGTNSIAPNGKTVPTGMVYFVSSVTVDGTPWGAPVTALATRSTSTTVPFAVSGSIEIEDSDDRVDAWDSNLGPYGPSTIVPAEIQTNSTGNGAVSIEGGTIEGNIKVGPGGSPGSVIDTSGGGNYTGTASAAASAAAIPTHLPPFPANSNDQSFSGGIASLIPGAYGDLEVKGTAILNLTAGDYVIKNLDMDGFGSIAISGDVNIYFAGEVQLAQNAQINDGGSSQSLKMYGTSTSNNDFRLDGNSRVKAEVSGQSLRLRSYDSAEYFGTFVGSGMVT